MHPALPRIGLATLATVLAGCVGPPLDLTPLGVPVPSNHSMFTVTVVADAMVRGSNTFTVDAVNAADQTPATLTHVFAVMPAHGHTSNVPLVVQLAPGSFRVDGLDLTMAGEWRVDLTLSHTGANDDDVASVMTEVQ